MSQEVNGIMHPSSELKGFERWGAEKINKQAYRKDIGNRLKKIKAIEDASTLEIRYRPAGGKPYAYKFRADIDAVTETSEGEYTVAIRLESDDDEEVVKVYATPDARIMSERALGFRWVGYFLPVDDAKEAFDEGSDRELVSVPA